MGWITLSDIDATPIRVNVDHIVYFQEASDQSGTVVCMGGVGRDRIVVTVAETVHQISELIEGPKRPFPLENV